MPVSYRDAAIALWGDAGAYVHDVYAHWQPILYPELPRQLPITIGITAYGHCLGLTRPDWEHGPRISIWSTWFKKGRGAVEDVVIHEMLHAWLAVTGQDVAHASLPWYAAVRRLSPTVLGHKLDARRGADRKSVRVSNPDYQPGNGKPRTVVRKVQVGDAVQHGDVARWPYSLRPAGYDWGEPLYCPTY